MTTNNYTANELSSMIAKEFRAIVRKGEWTGPTPEVCRGYAQANLAVVPKDHAFDFLLFCNRNPRPCPVIDVTDPGSPHPLFAAPEADLRTDLPRYSVYNNGQLVAEPTDISEYWQNDLVAFLLGCSGSFDWSLQAANIRYRLIGAYTTSIQCIPAGPFHGPMAVTCRLIKGTRDVVRTIQISSRHLTMHGPPIHIGDPATIGIKNLYEPEVFFSKDIAPQEPDEIAMFWGCGITPQVVAQEARLPLMITHYPAHMFITDWLSEELAVI